MKKTVLGAAAVAATSLVGAAPMTAAAEPVSMQAASYAELLQPIPNATEQLKISDMAASRAEPRLTEAQYVYHHHHHHHHHRRHRRVHHHHHNTYPPQ